MICNSFNHSPYCPSYKNSALKGASATTTKVQQQQPPKQLMFNQSELNLLGKSLEACKFFITKNQQMFQQPNNDILNEINQSLKILKPRNSNSLKGASVCNNPYKSLDNIRKMVGLGLN